MSAACRSGSAEHSRHATEAARVGGTGARLAPASGDTSPGHELVQLLLVLLVLGGDGVLGLLLHGLYEVLHVLEGVDLYRTKHGEPLGIRPGLAGEKPPFF